MARTAGPLSCMLAHMDDKSADELTSLERARFELQLCRFFGYRPGRLPFQLSEHVTEFARALVRLATDERTTVPMEAPQAVQLRADALFGEEDITRPIRPVPRR